LAGTAVKRAITTKPGKSTAFEKRAKMSPKTKSLIPSKKLDTRDRRPVTMSLNDLKLPNVQVFLGLTGFFRRIINVYQYYRLSERRVVQSAVEIGEPCFV